MDRALTQAAGVVRYETNPSTAMLTHRKPRPVRGPRLSDGPAVDVPIDECVIR